MARLRAGLFLESLVTFQAEAEWLDARDPDPRPSLLGVFQDLPYLPEDFHVYFDLRPGALDEFRLRLRFRKLRRGGVWHESGEVAMVLDQAGFLRGLYHVGVSPPAGSSVVELLVDGSIAGSRVIKFRHG